MVKEVSDDSDTHKSFNDIFTSFKNINNKWCNQWLWVHADRIGWFPLSWFFLRSSPLGTKWPPFRRRFLSEASFGLRVLSLPASVCVCVCPSVRQSLLLVRAITRDPFKLGSPNLDQRCKRPWLISLLFWGAIDHDLQGQIQLKSQNLPHFELVRTIARYPFKLGSPNLDQICKIAWFRSLLFWVAINLDLQSQIWLKIEFSCLTTTGNT